MNDTNILPDNVAYLDHPAYWQDMIELGYVVKGYWDEQDKTQKDLLAKARGGK